MEGSSNSKRRGPDGLFLSSVEHSTGKGAHLESLRKRVLVIDDDIDNARSLTYLLATMGHKVEYAINGIAALKIAQTFVPHVLVLDLKLPDVHGADMARQMRRDPQLRNARIIAITGSKLAQDRDRAIAGGCDEVLAKPVGVDVLDRLIQATKPV
jgi:CheY-like chemotaxis protein